VRHVIETATVVGPEGSDIHADEHGRVRARFHWDRSDVPDERASCWMRTSQLWSGQSWGAQFVPRVGMEVLVGFLQGDPDQPVILGCVPNAVRPLPFGMLTRSGFVTRSTPGGRRRNEVSFEDRDGAEELAIHAGRDLVMTSGRDAAVSVGGDSAARIGGDARSEIGGQLRLAVASDAEEAIGGSSTQRVGLGWTRSAGTDIVETAGADFRLTVAKGYTLSVAGIASTTVGSPDRPSAISDFVHGDHLVHATGVVRLVAEQGIRLSCGDSQVEITPSGVRIAAASIDLQGKEAVSAKGAGPSLSLAEEALLVADRVRIFAEKGQILLDKHARVNGETVKLNCDDEQKPPQKEDGSPIDLEPFRTKLTDHAFAPYADRTYHLVADGLRYEGTTNGEGLVDKQIPKGAKAIEITVWIGDYPEGERRTFHIRRGTSGPDTVEGAQARLANLGYLKGALSGTLDDATRAALVSFQIDAGLSGTGALDEATAARLAAVQGT
jgi:type VI secretion system secreted protein VgrG